MSYILNTSADLAFVFQVSLGVTENSNQEIYGQYFDEANYGFDVEAVDDDGNLRFSNRRVRSNDYEIIDCVKNNFVYGSSIPLNFTEESYAQVRGQFTIVSTNENSLDYLLSKNWDGARYKILVGGTINKKKYNEETIDFSDYLTFISGQVNGYDWNDREIGIALGSTDQALDVPFPPNIYTSGEHEGKSKPYVIGRVYNITPVDLGDGIFQFHDGDVDQIIEVRDKGVVLTSAGFSTNLESESPSSGEYYYSNRGTIKVGGDPAQITLDVQSEETIASRVFTALVKEHTAIDDFSVEYIGYQMGWYVTDITTLKDLLYRLSSGMDLNVGVDRFGKFFLKKRKNPIDTPSSFQITESDIDPKSLKRTASPKRPRVYQVEYRKNWTVQNTSDLPAAVRSKYSSRGLYSSSKNNVGITTIDLKYIETALVDKIDADEIRDLIYRDSRKRHTVRFKIRNSKWDIQAGDIGEVNHPRLPFTKMEVLSVTVDPVKKQVDLGVNGIE